MGGGLYATYTTFVTSENFGFHLALISIFFVTVGGSAMSMDLPQVGATEVVGLIVAFLVLVFTFASLLAAGMPLVIALLGVGIALAGACPGTVAAQVGAGVKRPG